MSAKQPLNIRYPLQVFEHNGVRYTAAGERLSTSAELRVTLYLGYPRQDQLGQAASRRGSREKMSAAIERTARMLLPEHGVLAAPFTARQCPDCKVWVYVADGPIGEDGSDPTKELASYNHWAREHATPEELSGTCFMFPFFSYNEQPVAAVKEN